MQTNVSSEIVQRCIVFNSPVSLFSASSIFLTPSMPISGLSYTQSWTSVNCSDVATLIHAGFPLNATNKFFSSNSNRSDCCPCYDFLHGKRKDHQLFTSCQTWFEKIYGLETRKGNIIDEVSWLRSIDKEFFIADGVSQWYLSCGENSQENLLLGSLSFLVAEIIGVIIVGILADRYGRKLMLLMCLYVPVVCIAIRSRLLFNPFVSLAFRIVSSVYDDVQSVLDSSLACWISQSSKIEIDFLVTESSDF